MTFGLVLDALIIVLLGATIAYGVVLSRRLASLRARQSELQNLIETLNEATKHAEAGIAGLKSTAEQAGVGLQASIDKARWLNEELSFRMDRAGKSTDRGRGANDVIADEPHGDGRKRLEREILSALRAVR